VPWSHFDHRPFEFRGLGMFSRRLTVLLVLLLVSSVAAQEKNPKKIDGWGNVENRRKDCEFQQDGGKLTINVPGTPHNLNKVISDLNAPKVLQEIEGDFTIQVKVSGDFDPSPISTVAPRGKAYNGAGLLLWVSEDLFLRLERNIWINGPNSADCHPPLFEVVIRGVPAGTSPAPVPAKFFSTPATWFRLERTGNSVSGSLSHNGTDWSACGTTTMNLPKKISIGVAAVNTSKKPFSATFEDLKVTAK
jgi:regulation of enolase protein 1 (concanavalin A-like superfamily)